MPIELLVYNPGTHRVRAQRTLDPERDAELDSNPYSEASQAYLHSLLTGDAIDPTRPDPAFVALRDDLEEHGQTDPGIITRTGVLVNGNTRRAALKDLGQANIRVAVLPDDASLDDVDAIELALQLRREHKRDYSFVNFLLALDEQIQAGKRPADIQRDFRIKATTFERSRWILAFIREVIERSKVALPSGRTVSMRLVDFETHQGKLEELYRAYTTAAGRSPHEADALREQRLLALALGGSKTDLRLVDHDFHQKFLKNSVELPPVEAPPPATIPGTTIAAPAPDLEVRQLAELTNEILRARAVESSPVIATPDDVARAAAVTVSLGDAMKKGLELAGRNANLRRRQLAAADRLSDANDSIELSIDAVVDARSRNALIIDDIDEQLTRTKVLLQRLATHLTRADEQGGDGMEWLKAAVGDAT